MQNRDAMRTRRCLWMAAAVALAIPLGCGETASDPDNARCNAPNPSFSAVQASGDHSEVSVRFACEGVGLSGTAYLPLAAGPHPAVVWVSGDGPHRRLAFGPMVAKFLDSGVAFLSYDKRGVGQSQGTCCPGDYGHFNLLTADAVGAINALRARADIDIDPRQIGLVGASQAGWIVPRAAVVSQQAAFIALASAGILPYGQVKAYAQLTGGNESSTPFPSKDTIAKRLSDAGPSGFDPKPFLAQLTIPALWLYGTADREVPVDQSVALLTTLKGQGKDFTIVTFPDAGHGLLDSPPTDPQAPSTFVAWVLKRVHVARS